MSESTTFGDYIRELRDAANLGLREASRLLNISSSYLSRLESNDYGPPSGEKLHRMARLYNADIGEMMRFANTRAHEMMAADVDAAPAVKAFYRLAQDQTPENQELMLKGAIDALNLPDEQKRILTDRLKAALSSTRGKDLPRRAKGEDGLFAFDIAPRILSKSYLEDFALKLLTTVLGTNYPIPVPIEAIIRKLAPSIMLIIEDNVEGGRLPDGTPAVLGLSRWSADGERRELLIHAEIFDSDRPSVQRRANFTMAHELFHCVEHLSLVQDRNGEETFKRGGALVAHTSQPAVGPWYDQKRKHRKLSSREDWREWQANTFAAALLMPAPSVIAIFTEMVDSEQIEAEEESAIEEIADALAREPFEDQFGVTASLAERFDVNPQAMAIRLISLDLVSDQSR